MTTITMNIKAKRQSSFIDEITYLGNDLYIKIGARVYRYSNVPYSVFKRVINAESQGKAYNALIKNQYFMTLL